MKLVPKGPGALAALALALAAMHVVAADYPAPKEGDWVVRDFRFHTGETLPELKLHYTTVGAPGVASSKRAVIWNTWAV